MNELYAKSATGSDSENDTRTKFNQELANAIPELTNIEAKDIKIPFSSKIIFFFRNKYPFLLLSSLEP